MRQGLVIVSILCVIFNVGACSSDDSEPAPSPPDPNAPRYYEQIAPILTESCVGCHREGGIAPFSLTDYESAYERADLIAAVTASRQMPPMPVNNDGTCNTYSNARWLSQAEIDRISAWAEAGAPEGDEANAPELPEPPKELEDPDAMIDIGVDYVPNQAEGHDDYRCFVVPAPVDEAAFLSEYQVFPGDSRVVHHVIVYQPHSRADAEAAHALDEAEAGDGYTCFGGPGISASPFALWAPGSGSTTLPEGTGVPLAADRELVVQIHYNFENGAFPDRTRVGLRFASEPVIPAQYLDVANGELRLQPGRERVESTATTPLPEPVSFKVHGALPHMHTLGRTLRVEAEADGETRCLVDVDRWDFHWQNSWWYDRPLALKDVSALSIRCGYDTRGRDEVVTWGEGTEDEMCISYFYVTAQDAPDPEVSCTNTTNPLFGSCFDDFLSGCYEPDLSGNCSVENGVLTWEDGSKLVTQGANTGFFAPDAETPCITLGASPTGGAVFGKGDEEVTYTPAGNALEVECPDGTQLSATAFQVREFNECRGLACL
jgi:hypothetical protein